MQLDDIGVKIAQLVLARGPILIDAIADDVGVSDAVCGTRVRNLCMERLFKRDGDRVSVLAKSRLEALIDQAGTQPQAAAPKPAAEKIIDHPHARPKFAAPAIVRIEKGIPIPEHKLPPRPSPWPFAAMDIGDSFAVDVPDIPPGITAINVGQSLRSAASAFSKRNAEWAFTIRIAEDRKSVRLWREVPKNTPATHDVSNVKVLPRQRRVSKNAA